MDILENNEHVTVNNPEELLMAVKNKKPYILISSDYKDEFLENTDLPLSEIEIMGFELGARGNAQLTGGLLYPIINFFSKGSKVQKQIDSRLRKYTYKKTSEHDILLYLRHFDY
ncbi:hypothetical protein [Ornithinibacillus contaminans]|uniref:hypothetical protein n=1 Tax=Ornithinibacillus contaminans TaxID=694055 RepID=UPI001F3E70A3|nr:hypothetical protein [Ornithinibacillus contaminans]